MLNYLVIILDDTSISYCHYCNKGISNLIPLETLQKGILFAMKHNLKLQYILPKYRLPQEYISLIESMFHNNIGPFEQNEMSDVVVFENLIELKSNAESLNIDKKYLVRTTVSEFFNDYAVLKDVMEKNISINVVFSDIESFTDSDIETYKLILKDLRLFVKNLVLNGCSVNTNLLTDRIALSEMNNCGAGDTTITLAPNGVFYPCPAFYFSNDSFTEMGNIETGLKIRNKRLFTIECSPLCKRCDAFHCKRCVWLNKQLTYEVNIPSRQQCIMSHLERNASRDLLEDFHKQNILKEVSIKEINYLDPFDVFQRV